MPGYRMPACLKHSGTKQDFCAVFEKDSADDESQSEIPAQQIEHDGVFMLSQNREKFLYRPDFFTIGTNYDIAGPEAVQPRGTVCVYFGHQHTFNSPPR